MNTTAKRAIYVVAALFIAALVILVSYICFANHYEKAEYSEVTLDEAYIEDGVFCGTFRCDKDGFMIAGFDWYTDGGDLYITALLTTYEEKAAKTDERGYALCEIDLGGEEIDDCYYIHNGKTDILPVD